jgi:hypothetical protein
MLLLPKHLFKAFKLATKQKTVSLALNIIVLVQCVSGKKKHNAQLNDFISVEKLKSDVDFGSYT